MTQYAPFWPVEYRAYFEPFVGGAAVFLEMVRRGLDPQRQRVRLSDSNEELMNLYRILQAHPQELMGRLAWHAQEHDQEHFYAVRAWDVEQLSEVQRAARLVYLNRTCFNGLYRVNQKGLFNVPFGRYKNPSILNESRLWAVHQALQGVQLEVAPYDSVASRAKKGDFVYFDPPYQPLSSSSSFTSYTRSSFGEAQQRQLAELFTSLDKRGVQVLLSNSDAPLVRELYRDFSIRSVSAPRFINSKADQRSAISEVLVIGHRVSANFQLERVG